MLRQMIKINEEKCNGCGACVTACHEGAIELQNGIAKLVREDYCDGLGNCLPVCPTGAITFEDREAAEFKKVLDLPCGCPGTQSRQIERKESKESNTHPIPLIQGNESQLQQWPVQIKLVPVNAPYFDNANLLVSADCAAYAYANFHNEFIKNRITLIGCPKLDEGDYTEKLTAIIKSNNLKSIMVVRMEVPCCGGIVNALTEAIKRSGKMIPWQIVTIGTDGSIID